MNRETKKKFSNILSTASIFLLLIALLIGTSFIRVGTQNLTAINNIDIDLETFTKEAIETECEIVTITPSVTSVRYYVDGEEYTNDMEVYSDEYSVGSKLKLYYSIENPKNIRVPDIFRSYYKKMGKTMLKIGIVIVVVCGGLGAAFLVISKSLRKKISRSE